MKNSTLNRYTSYKTLGDLYNFSLLFMIINTVYYVFPNALSITCMYIIYVSYNAFNIIGCICSNEYELVEKFKKNGMRYWSYNPDIKKSKSKGFYYISTEYGVKAIKLAIITWFFYPVIIKSEFLIFEGSFYMFCIVIYAFLYMFKYNQIANKQIKSLNKE